MKNRKQLANTSARGYGRAAFTVAELLMVLTIMTMLLSMSVAAYHSMTRSKGTDGARKTIASALFTARMKAIRDRRDVTVALSVPGALDSGWIVDVPASANTVGVINRMKRPTEDLDSIMTNTAIHKGWVIGKFQPGTDKAYWACVVGGPGTGSKVMISQAANAWVLRLKSSFQKPARDNSSLCILEGSRSTNSPPVIQQYKVTSDMLGGSWEDLPKFVIVDGTYFPITFRPDGTAAFPYDHAVIRLRDIRASNDLWQWRMIVDRGSGSCSASRVRPSDRDSKAEF